jgi:flagellar basal-body rod protein FlgF
MERGLYIAASGMLAEQARQDLIAHDLANASTPGYKPDRVSSKSFGAMLLHDTSSGANIGALGLGTQIDKQVTDMTPGPLRETGEPLDFAVQGDGFFSVKTPAGVRYTRDGQFAASARGTLTNAAGDDVLGPGGAPIRIAADGRVAASAIGVTALTNPRRQGDTLFTGTVATTATGAVRPGTLESSAVDPVHTMVDMLGSLRAFEAGQRVITTIDSTLQKAANQVGSL